MMAEEKLTEVELKELDFSAVEYEDADIDYQALEDMEPPELIEADEDDVAEPPETWKADAHEDELKRDPLTVLTDEEKS